MKITMLTLLCGPNGTAFPGTVLDLPQKEATEMIETMHARKYDAAKDKLAVRGLQRAPAVPKIEEFAEQ